MKNISDTVCMPRTLVTGCGVLWVGVDKKGRDIIKCERPDQPPTVIGRIADWG